MIHLLLGNIISFWKGGDSRIANLMMKVIFEGHDRKSFLDKKSVPCFDGHEINLDKGIISEQINRYPVLS